MSKSLPAVCSLLALTSFAKAQDEAPSALRAQLREASVPVHFLENNGWTDPRAAFAARGTRLTSFFTSDGFRFVIASGGTAPDARVFFTFEGGAAKAIQPVDALPGHTLHLRGGSQTLARSYAGIRYDELYSGVDLVFHGRGGEVEYDVELAAGASLEQVVVRVDGAEGLSIDASGALVVRTRAGDLRQELPATWEIDGNGERVPRRACFRILDADHFGFDVPGWSGAGRLVIDPTFEFGTYLGGSGRDDARDIVLGIDGSVYITGVTSSADFPTTPGSFGTQGQGRAAFVSKLSADVSALVYTAVFDGGQDDFGQSLAVNDAGEVVAVGITQSRDFPTTAGALFPTYRGGVEDGYALKLNRAGTALVWSTYLGGAAEDAAERVILLRGDAIIAGRTQSDLYPTTAGAFQTTRAGASDAFVTKLNARTGALVQSTFLGGTGADSGFGLAVGNNLQLVLVGSTESPDFPTTTGVEQERIGGARDAFVALLSVNLARRIAATYLGGTLNEDGFGLSLDILDRVYMTGHTESSDFPTTTGAVQETYGGGTSDAYVAAFMPDLTLRYATYLGGGDFEFSYDIDTQPNGTAYITGCTASIDHPLTANAFDNRLEGSFELMLARIGLNGDNLEYSTLLGGSGGSEGFGTFYDPCEGKVLITGVALTAMQTSAGAFQPGYGGSRDAFVACFDFNPAVGGAPALVNTNLPACQDPRDPVLTATRPVFTNELSLFLDSIFPRSPVVIQASFGPPPAAPIFFPGSNCRIWLDAVTPGNLMTFGVGTTDADGDFRVAVLVRIDPAFVGLDMVFQGRVCDPTNPGPLFPFPDWFSNAVHTRFGCR